MIILSLKASASIYIVNQRQANIVIALKPFSINIERESFHQNKIEISNKNLLQQD